MMHLLMGKSPHRGLLSWCVAIRMQTFWVPLSVFLGTEAHEIDGWLLHNEIKPLEDDEVGHELHHLCCVPGLDGAGGCGGVRPAVVPSVWPPPSSPAGRANKPAGGGLGEVGGGQWSVVGSENGRGCGGGQRW